MSNKLYFLLTTSAASQALTFDYVSRYVQRKSYYA